jgi:bifunctional non-homologous end joining protein LigD
MPQQRHPLDTYRAKRNFGKTPEPQPESERDEPAAAPEALAFVIQKHAATRLHYDFRLELDGVMLSWAVPKGPSYDPADKRMAVRTEDHPISYNSFEGTIPRGQYGAGTVIIWDRGTWTPLADPHQGLAEGKLVFTLHGHKMAGMWELVRIAKPGDRQIAWLLFKKRDGLERPKAAYDVVSALPDSVVAKPLKALSASAAAPPPAGPATARRDGMPDGAVKAPNPKAIGPQLATLATGVPADGEWLFEIKLDGYRLMTRIEENGEPRLITRGSHDWTSKMPGLARELASLGLRSAWLDGEIVVLGERGLPDFNALQQAFDRRKSDLIVYFLFDLPYLNGHDLRGVSLSERRTLLKSLLQGRALKQLRLSADFRADPAQILESARQMQLEGVIAKRADAPYVSARTETWLKLKCRQRQEFVVCAFTDRAGEAASPEIGSLLLGVHAAGGELVTVGGVGTGWDTRTATDLKRRLLKIEIDKPAFAQALTPGKSRWTRKPASAERWVKPTLVVEVSFADWTPDAQIRHAKFEGVRVDKPAREVMREVAATPAGALPLRPQRSGTTRVSNPDRVVDASTGLTKLDIVRYYEAVAPWILPHLKGRPVSLVRGPDGIAGELFFQKHADKLQIPDVKQLDASLWPGHEPLLEVSSARALAGAAQMNTIELHTWNATKAHIDKPDRMIFDIDPGEGVPWHQVQEAALLTHGLLQELGLKAWLKTSGGKGLHVVVPLSPRHDWATVKDFSHNVVLHLARVIPGRFVAKSGPANRVGRIFVDYLRNSHGATTAAAYSARARPGLGVSMPLRWDELASIRSSAQWTVATAREHLSFHPQDPWADYWACRQTLTRARKTLAQAAA